MMVLKVSRGSMFIPQVIVYHITQLCIGQPQLNLYN